MEEAQKAKYLKSSQDSINFILNLDTTNMTESDVNSVSINYNHISYLEENGVFQSISFQQLQTLRSAQRKAKDILNIP